MQVEKMVRADTSSCTPLANLVVQLHSHSRSPALLAVSFAPLSSEHANTSSNSRACASVHASSRDLEIAFAAALLRLPC